MLSKIEHLFPGDLGVDVVIPEKGEHIDPVLGALDSEFELEFEQNVSFDFDD